MELEELDKKIAAKELECEAADQKVRDLYSDCSQRTALSCIESILMALESLGNMIQKIENPPAYLERRIETDFLVISSCAIRLSEIEIDRQKN